MTAGATGRGAREHLWLPLLRELTERVPEWAVWKNADSALLGTGDVDSAAPRRVWPAIQRTFEEWTAAHDLGPTVACRHIPRTANYFALLPGSTSLLQLEVKAAATFRGSLQFRAEDVLALSVLDPRGFRKLRPGAEGLLKLVNNGMTRGGRQDAVGLAEKDVVALLREDPEGVAAMASVFGRGAPALRAAIDAVLAGGWDRGAMLRVEAWALARALVQPQVVVERVWFRAHRKRTCPVLRSVYRRGREVPPDAVAWFAEVAAGHEVTRLPGRSGG